MSATVATLETTTTPLTRRLRTRQALTRVMVAQRLLGECLHPSRHAHVDDDVRTELEGCYRDATTSLRRAETLLGGGE